MNWIHVKLQGKCFRDRHVHTYVTYFLINLLNAHVKTFIPNYKDFTNVWLQALKVKQNKHHAITYNSQN